MSSDIYFALCLELPFSQSLKHCPWLFVSTSFSRAVIILNLWEFPGFLIISWLFKILNENDPSKMNSLHSEIQYILNCRHLDFPFWNSQVQQSFKVIFDIFYLIKEAEIHNARKECISEVVFITIFSASSGVHFDMYMLH